MHSIATGPACLRHTGPVFASTPRSVATIRDRSRNRDDGHVPGHSRNALCPRTCSLGRRYSRIRTTRCHSLHRKRRRRTSSRLRSWHSHSRRNRNGRRIRSHRGSLSCERDNRNPRPARIHSPCHDDRPVPRKRRSIRNHRNCTVRPCNNRGSRNRHTSSWTRREREPSCRNRHRTRLPWVPSRCRLRRNRQDAPREARHLRGLKPA